MRGKCRSVRYIRRGRKVQLTVHGRQTR